MLSDDEELLIYLKSGNEEDDETVERERDVLFRFSRHGDRDRFRDVF